MAASAAVQAGQRRAAPAVGCRRRPPRPCRPPTSQPPRNHPARQAVTPPQWATDIAALMGTNTKPASGVDSPEGVVLKTHAATAEGPK